MNNIFPRIILGTALILASSVALAKAEVLDRIAVIVGKDVITKTTVDARVAEIQKRASTGGMRLPDPKTLEKQVVDHLISEQLQLQMAERVGLKVDDLHVNKAIENMRKNNKMDHATFLRVLEEDGVTLDDLRKRMRKDITIQQIQQALVSQRIQISDLEINNFLKSADAQFWMSPEYNIGHILIGLPQSASNADAKDAEDKAMRIYEQIKKGAVFAELAIAHSNGPLALKGGEMGWRRTTDLPSLFAEIIPTLEEGGISKPARSGAGFHILKLYKKRGDNTQVVKQTRARHILLKSSAILTNEEAEAKLKEIRQEILDGADFAEMAKEHSEDIGTMLSGGDLGWANPGQFVPEFETTMQESNIGDISEPFRSQFGWHILQVMERRDEDMTDAVIRHKAKNILTNRRFEDELQVWLIELQDDAFIERKLTTEVESES